MRACPLCWRPPTSNGPVSKPSDWLEAFSAHPRIGRDGRACPAASNREQKGVMTAGRTPWPCWPRESPLRGEVRPRLLVSAAGRSAEDVVAAMRQRIENDPATELQVAAEEQRKITRLPSRAC